MTVVLTAIEREIMECIGTYGNVRCFIFDPDNQPSVQAKLEKGWDPIVWWIYNGSSLMSSNHPPIPLSSRVVCCLKHEDALIKRGGWDGTGERQNNA
jgi:hypothetical protein